MLIVTLAGGIGSGKSTVAAALAECGARLLSLDDVARDVLSPGEEAVREVGDLWPEAVREGKIDRAALARIVFDDAAALARLNAVVHPRTWERAQAQLASWREESLQAQSAREFVVVVVELALLAGSPYQDAYHGTIVVDAPEDVRVLRLVDSRGMDEADARARIASQTPASRVRELADVVVDNGGSLEDAARAARELWEGWLVPYAANMREGRRVFGGDAPPSPGQRARAAARLTRQGAFVNRESALGGGGGETAGDKGGGVLEIVGPADESSLAKAGFVPCAGELRAASQTYKSRRVSPDARRDASGDSGDVASGSGNCAPGGPRLYVSADPRFAMAAVVTGEHD